MKKKIKKFGGGALSAVDSESIQSSSIDKDSESIQSSSIDKDSESIQSSSIDKDLVLNPELSVSKMGDDIMDPKQTISSKSLGIEKGFDVGRVGAKIFKSDVKYDSIPVPPTSTKGIEGSFTTPGGTSLYGGYEKSQTGESKGSGFTAGARFKVKFNKGGYSTFNQDNTVVKTGGFADSNYQDYVKTLIEK
jgi:hypothetical protein